MKELLKKAELKKKLSVKTVYGVIDPMKAFGTITDGKPEKPVIPIMRCIGRVVGIKTGNSTYGQWLAFKGDFVAINMLDEKSFRGTQLFLPEVAAALIENAFILGEAQVVDIAFDIKAEFDATSATKYVYTAAPLMDISESDPLQALLSSVADQFPALPSVASNQKAEEPIGQNANKNHNHKSQGGKG